MNVENEMAAEIASATPSIEVIKKHALSIRWTHWVNFPLLTLMLVSGLFIYWANSVYTPFIPESVYQTLGLSHKLSYGMGIHFFFMWFFMLNGFAYLFFLVWTGEWRELMPRLSSLRDAIAVTLHDFGLRKGLPSQGKFNGAQRFAYSGILALGFLQILTGFAIYKPVQLQWLVTLFGGYEGARLVHFIVMILILLFFLTHVAQVVRAGWNNFRSMVTGSEEVTGDEVQRAQGIFKAPVASGVDHE